MEKLTLQKYEIQGLRELLDVISEENRFLILTTLLASGKPLSFNDVVVLLGKNPSSAAHHLKILMKYHLIENSKIINARKNERKSLYKLSNEGRKLLKILGILKGEKELQTLFKKIFQ